MDNTETNSETKASGKGEKDKTKLVSFRIREEDDKEFHAMLKRMGCTQAQGFDHLMQVLQMNEAKELYPERATEIEEFERALKSIGDIYDASVGMAQNAEERAKEQFSRDLASKDRAIANLQERAEMALQAQKAAEQAAQDNADAKEAAEQRANSAEREREAAQKTIADKECSIKLLTEKLEAQEKQLVDCEELRASAASYKDQVVDLEVQLKDAGAENRSLREALEAREKQAQLEAELAATNAAHDAEKSMEDKLRAADQEIARLNAVIDQMRKDG